MLVSFRAGGPVTCDEHGELPGRLLSDRDRQILMLEHLCDVHGEDQRDLLEKTRASGFAVTSVPS